MPVAPVPAVPAGPTRRWAAQAALVFFLVIGLLGLVLAVAPSRLLATISAGLPERRQDLGLGLAVVMALRTGVLVVFFAV